MKICQWSHEREISQEALPWFFMRARGRGCKFKITSIIKKKGRLVKYLLHFNHCDMQWGYKNEFYMLSNNL